MGWFTLFYEDAFGVTRLGKLTFAFSILGLLFWKCNRISVLKIGASDCGAEKLYDERNFYKKG